MQGFNEYYPDQGALMDDEGRFTPEFWNQHPDSVERRELRDWVDQWAKAAESVVHAEMTKSYDAVQATINAGNSVEAKGMLGVGAAPNLGATAAAETVDKPIDLDAERVKRRPVQAEVQDVSAGSGVMPGVVRQAAR